ncbi:MAG: prolipoprotein diacylglyceryl transferase [Myxococcota bacterium]
MYPTLHTQQTAFGEVPYNSWGLMITLAFLAAVIVSHRRAGRVGIDPDKMVGVYLVAIVLGLAGARLLHFLMATPDVFFADPMIFFRLWQGGFAFYGGFILAGVGTVLYAMRKGIDAWKLADVIGPTVMLGLAFGRIGCFLAGCCHGAQFDLPANATPLFPDTFSGGQLFAFGHFPFLGEMTRHGVGHNNVVVYPTQLWESFAALTIFAITSLVWRYRKFDGQVIAAVLILYSIWRPINESMRGDEVRGLDYFGLFTTSQLISIPVAVGGLAIVALQFRKGVKPETPFRHEEEPETASAPRL